ncbi:MAG: DUF1294 domain-containing protein [Clostridia bacterium]|nr:DUF1294 domain-containing protein [Clostridia bacterium]
MIGSTAARDVLLAYLGAINLSAFAAFFVDKRRAVKGGRRIPESTLWIVTAVGGALGSLLGMLFCRHKTRKPEFRLGVPMLCAAQLVIVYLLFK